MCTVVKGQDIFLGAVMPLKSWWSWGAQGELVEDGEEVLCWVAKCWFRCKTSDLKVPQRRHNNQAGLKIRYLWFKRGSPAFSPSQKGMLGIPGKGAEIKTENIFILLSGSFLSLLALAAAQLKDFKQKWLRRVKRSVLHESRINQIRNLDSGKTGQREKCVTDV